MERPLSIPRDLPPLKSRRGEWELAAIFAGGFIGALLRTGVEHAFPVHAGSWPWPTFAVNIAAAALLGYLVAHTRASPAPSLYARAFIGAGVCGALSTFSTLIVELLGLLEGSYWGLAVAYGAASIAAGLLVVALAGGLARRRAAARR